MSQMRKDVFTGRWVIVAETDAVRPTDFQFRPFTKGAAFCPFCETNEASTPPEVFAVRRPGSLANGPAWQVRVVPNNQPQLRIEGGLGRRGEGFHDLMNGIGAHEIIAETPRHDPSLHDLEMEEIANLIRAYVARIVDLEQDLRMRYVLIFKNHGQEAGAHTITHSISQLMALPVVPRTIKSKLMVARDYYAQKELHRTHSSPARLPHGFATAACKATLHSEGSTLWVTLSVRHPTHEVRETRRLSGVNYSFRPGGLIVADQPTDDTARVTRASPEGRETGVNVSP